MLLYTILGARSVEFDGRYQAVTEYGCAHCGRYVCTETIELHKYLVSVQCTLYCEVCDQLPDRWPDVLDVDSAGVVWVSKQPDARAVSERCSERVSGVVACLLGHNSTRND